MELPAGVFVLDGLFSEEELAGFEAVLAGAAPRTRAFTTSDFRNGKLVDERTAALLYDRVAPRLPPMYTDRHGVAWRPVGPCRFVMFAEVQPGQQFNLHTDTGCEYEDSGRERSRFTLLTYLNSSTSSTEVPTRGVSHRSRSKNDDYTGGETEFFDGAFRPTGAVTPLRGRTLVFDIDLWHRGRPVTAGASKRWIGTEVVAQEVMVQDVN